MKKPKAALLEIVPGQPVNQEVIKFLEDVLGRARNGEYSSVAVATVGRDGTMGNGWSTLYSHAIMLGSITRLLYRINESIECS